MCSLIYSESDFLADRTGPSPTATGHASATALASCDGCG
jgi:hypothetical protein